MTDGIQAAEFIDMSGLITFPIFISQFGALISQPLKYQKRKLLLRLIQLSQINPISLKKLE